MRDLKVGEMHWRDGVIFSADHDGNVSIEIPADDPIAPPHRTFVIPASEWASIILHCARANVDPFAPHPSIEDAQAFHRGQR